MVRYSVVNRSQYLALRLAGQMLSSTLCSSRVSRLPGSNRWSRRVTALNPGHDRQLVGLDVVETLAHRLHRRHVGVFCRTSNPGHHLLGLQRRLAGRRLQRVVFDGTDGGAMSRNSPLTSPTGSRISARPRTVSRKIAPRMRMHPGRCSVGQPQVRQAGALQKGPNQNVGLGSVGWTAGLGLRGWVPLTVAGRSGAGCPDGPAGFRDRRRRARGCAGGGAGVCGSRRVGFGGGGCGAAGGGRLRPPVFGNHQSGIFRGVVSRPAAVQECRVTVGLEVPGWLDRDR